MTAETDIEHGDVNGGPEHTGPAHESMLPEGLPRLEEASEVSEVEGTADVERRKALVERLEERPNRSSMLDSFGWILRFIGSMLFAHVLFEKRSTENLRDVSERGTPVYVMQTRSLLDYLYFNYVFLQRDLPLARFANGLRMTWLRGPISWIKRLFSRSPAEKPEEQVEALVCEDKPVFLFLEKPRTEQEENVEFSQRYLTRMIRAQRKVDTPIFLVPMLLVWEKRPDPKRASFLDDIFGTAQRPGFFRKFVSFFQTFWQSFLRLGQPLVQISTTVNLQEFLREYPNAGTADASELLRERVGEYLDRERHVVLGPTGEKQGMLFQEMMQRPAITDAVREIAAEEDVDEEAIRERVRDQLEEIAASPSMLMIKVMSSVLSFVWYRIYDGFEVDEEGLERVREAAKSNSVVLIPSHKSHIDYLVLSYILFNYGMIPPLIAAGVNLSFWPLGPIFRRAGAFFLRRTFRGEKLYPIVFREYLVRQLEEGWPVEFFIEGTRSRTGKLVKPKYGMMDMVVRALASGRIDSIKVVPISVSYEKIIEETSYRREVLGAEKERESLTGLLKTPKFLTSQYGRLYVEFGEPIDLGGYLEKYDVDRVKPEDEELDELTVRLAHRVNYDINQVTTVTPSSLVAMVLLNNTSRGVERTRFLEQIGFLLHFLTYEDRTARLSRTLTEALDDQRERVEAPRSEQRAPALATSSGPSEPKAERVIGDVVANVVDEALGLFRENEQLDERRTEQSTFYAVPEESRFELAYYRNNIIHHFVPEALLATALRSFASQPIELGKLMEETRFLSRLFKYEWIYEESAEFENVFMRTLSFFDAAGWVTIDHNEHRTLVEYPEPFPAELQFFRRLVLSFLEAYAVVAEELPSLHEKKRGRDEIVEAALESGRNDYLGGRIIYYETISKPTFKNALRLFEDWDIIDRVEGKKSGSYEYTLDDEWGGPKACRVLQTRLERFVYSESEMRG
ncbi:MAG: 1-acyl-sn-glycerol-3-phosphate acyltransferase [Myxococcota bacterium]